jgi:hypothetical protein
LQEIGPLLGRPYVDTIYESKHKNMKELRIQNKQRLFRILFAFDPDRKAILLIRLSELRKQMGVKQEDIQAFTQSGISKIESRKDMKISTLVQYLNNIGMDLEGYMAYYLAIKLSNQRNSRRIGIT